VYGFDQWFVPGALITFIRKYSDAPDRPCPWGWRRGPRIVSTSGCQSVSIILFLIMKVLMASFHHKRFKSHGLPLGGKGGTGGSISSRLLSTSHYRLGSPNTSMQPHGHFLGDSYPYLILPIPPTLGAACAYVLGTRSAMRVFVRSCGRAPARARYARCALRAAVRARILVRTS